jgi:hypothetical protein
MRSSTTWLISGGAAAAAAALLWFGLSQPPQTAIADARALQAPGDVRGYSIDELMEISSRFPDMTAAAERLAPQKLEVCGVGSFTVPPGGDLPEEALAALRDAEQSAMRNLTARLMATGKERDRAVALLLRRYAAISEATAQAAPQICEGDACENTPVIAVKSPEATQKQAAGLAAAAAVISTPDTAAHTGALADMAQTTTDPLVLRLALNVCRREQPAPEACKSLSNATLAVLEPDNADAWLRAANEASRAGDSEAAAQAFTRASQATRFQNHGQPLLRTALQSASAQLRPVERLEMLSSVVGHAFLDVETPAMLVYDRCKLPQADQTRQAECSRTIDLLMQSDTAVNASVGYALQQKTARSNAQAEQARQALAALRFAGESMPINNGINDFASCKNITDASKHFARVAAAGEMQAIRDHLRSLDLTEAQAAALASVQRRQQ